MNFRTKTTKKNEEDIELIKNFIEARCNIVRSGKLSHIVAGAEVPNDESSYLLNCIENVSEMYQENRQSKLVERSKKLFDVIV